MNKATTRHFFPVIDTKKYTNCKYILFVAEDFKLTDFSFASVGSDFEFYGFPVEKNIKNAKMVFPGITYIYVFYYLFIYLIISALVFFICCYKNKELIS